MIHPNRLTTTLMNCGFLFPLEVTEWFSRRETSLVKMLIFPGSGVEQDKPAFEQDLSIERGVVELMSNAVFLSHGYQIGDQAQCSFGDNNELIIRPLKRSLIEQFEECEISEDGIAIPPAWLIQAFIGKPITDPFYASGRRLAQYFIELYERHFKSYDQVDKVVDFGSGCGRVLSHLSHHEGIYGIDLHKEAMQWMRLSMPKGHFFDGSNEFYLSSKVTDVDFLYAISVLTHLDQKDETHCLRDWQKTVKKKGCLIISFRDESWVKRYAYDALKDTILRNMQEGNGFYFGENKFWTGTFPEYYRDAYHSEEYIRERWGEFFTIKEIINWKDAKINQNIAILSNDKL